MILKRKILVSVTAPVLFGILFAIPLMVTCERFEPESRLIFRTESIEELEEGGFRVVGRIFNIGSEKIVQHGFCWSEFANPTITDQITELGTKDSEGTFSSDIHDLSMDTEYFVRAYVTTSEGTAYGKEITFTTPPPDIPTVITASVDVITETSAQGGGEVISDGGAAVTERGICWSTSPGPTITGHRTSDGSGTGVYLSYMDGLNCSSTYYVRAYATNYAGTGYGNEVSFSTPECIPEKGEFIFGDDNGTWILTHEGVKTQFTGGSSRSIEVYENKIYIKGGQDVTIYNRDGSLYGRVDIDDRIVYPYVMCVLPGGNFAFLDNDNDRVSFTNSTGELIEEMPIAGLSPDDHLQMLSGIVVDNSLIVSEDGNNRIIKIDLETYKWSVFRDFQHLTGWLGDIDYSDGTYYLCKSMKIYSFRENEEENLVCQMPEGNNSGIAVLGDFAYVTSSFGNKIYRVNVRSGDYEVIVDADYPQDIELIE